MKLKKVRSYLDKRIAEKLETTTISCKKKCPHCCKQPVGCLYEEVKEISKLKIDIDKDRLTKQVFDLGADKTCIFLKDGCCSIYDHRPLTCRLYMVTVSPSRCAYYNNVPRVHVPEADALLKALFRTYGKVSLHVSLYGILSGAGDV